MQVKAPVPWLSPVPLAPTECLVELRRLSAEPCQLRITGKAKMSSLDKGWLHSEGFSLPQVVLAGRWDLRPDGTP